MEGREGAVDWSSKMIFPDLYFRNEAFFVVVPELLSILMREVRDIWLMNGLERLRRNEVWGFLASSFLF